MAGFTAWERLPVLPRRSGRPDTELLGPDDLEQVWSRGPGAVAHHDRAATPFDDEGEFFRIHLVDVEQALGTRAWIWLARAQSFVERTAPWRETLRARDLSAFSTLERRVAAAAIDVWLLLAAPADTGTVQGTFLRCYREQLTAMTSTSLVTSVGAFERGAELCLAPAPSLSDVDVVALQSLRRHGHHMRTRALHLSAFLLMRRHPRPWGEIRANFQRAAMSCRSAEHDRSSARSNSQYYELWDCLTGIRESQERGDVDSADEFLQQALSLFDACFERGTQMRARGPWTSRRSLEVETHINEAIRLLHTEPASLDGVLTAAMRWLRDAPLDELSSQKVEIMQIRCEVLRVMIEVRAGGAIGTALSRIRRRADANPYVAAHFAETLDALGRLPRRNRDLTRAVAAFRTSFQHVDGFDQSLPNQTSVRAVLPAWGDLSADGTDEGREFRAMTAYWRFVRVIVEYLWTVYARASSRLDIAIPEVDVVELRTLQPTELALAVTNLLRVLGWGPGKSRTALESLVSDVTARITPDPGERWIDAYSAMVAECATDLFPAVFEFTGPLPTNWPADVSVRRLVGPSRVMAARVSPSSRVSYPFLALNPILKQIDDLENVPDRHKGAAQLEFQSAFTWPRPTPVAVFLEGQSDVGAMSAGLDLYTGGSWRGGSVVLHDCGGDRLPAAVAAVLSAADARASVVMVVADADKLPDGPAFSRPWTAVWRDVPYTFCWSPDLERIDLESFSEAVFECTGKLLTLQELEGLVDDWSARDVTPRIPFGDFVANHIDEPGIKLSTIGYALGERLMRSDRGGLRQICRYAFALGEGHVVRPHRPRELDTSVQRLVRDRYPSLWE